MSRRARGHRLGNGPSRRWFLGTSLLLGVGAMGCRLLPGGDGGGDGSGSSRGGGSGDLPDLPPADLAASVPSVDGTPPSHPFAYLTPNAEFYKFANADPPPPEDASQSSLAVRSGGEELNVQWDELARLGLVEQIRTLQCLGNGKPGADDFPWRYGGISNARWSGVPVRKLLDHLDVQQDGPMLLCTGRDGWTRGTSAERVLADDGVFIALQMNGEPLPHAHGAPARLIAPGRFGELSVKWLRRIEWGEPPEGQHGDLVVKPMAFVRAPVWGQLSGGAIELEGVAYAGPHPVVGVSVDVKGVGVTEAEFLDEAQPHIWRRWRATLRPGRGWFHVSVGATDSAGRKSEVWDRAGGWGKGGVGITHELALGSKGEAKG